VSNMNKEAVSPYFVNRSSILLATAKFYEIMNVNLSKF